MQAQEVEYVLVRPAPVPREDAVDAMTNRLERENTLVHEVRNDLAIQTLAMCRPRGRINFGDAQLWAVARAASGCRVLPFDRKFPDADLDVRQP